LLEKNSLEEELKSVKDTLKQTERELKTLKMSIKEKDKLLRTTEAQRDFEKMKADALEGTRAEAEKLKVQIAELNAQIISQGEDVASASEGSKELE